MKETHGLKCSSYFEMNFVVDSGCGGGISGGGSDGGGGGCGDGGGG